MVSTNIILGVYSGKIGTSKLPKDYYDDFSKKMLKSVNAGTGKAAKYSSLNESLSINAQQFAGAKTYNLVRELEAAKVIFPSKKEFSEAAKVIVDKYDRWGEAEINTAKQQALQAKKWQEIEQDAELFPYLKYSAIGDPCKICKPLNGLIARVDDPIWRRIYPCNHYNCYCLVTQEGKGTRATSSKKRQQLEEESVALMHPTFTSNPGITKKIYTKDHPYFSTITKSEKGFARENFGLPIK